MMMLRRIRSLTCSSGCLTSLVRSARCPLVREKFSPSFRRLGSSVSKALLPSSSTSTPHPPPTAASRALRFLELSKTLQQRGDTCTLEDGRKMTKERLLVEAIAADPRCDFAFVLLAAMLSDNSMTVVLKSGQTLGRQELLLQALDINPRNSQAYCELGMSIREDEMVTMRSGEPWSCVRLFTEAINCDRSNVVAYNLLGNAMQKNEEVELCPEGQGGRKKAVNAQGVFVEAISIDPKDPTAYNNLGVLLEEGQTVTLKDGRTLNRQQLFLEATSIPNRSHPIAYVNLGLTLPPNATINISGQSDVTVRQLFLFAMRLGEPSAPSALADTMKEDETIQVSADGVIMDRKALYLEAVERGYMTAVYKLVGLLKSGESVTMSDGRVLSKRGLMLLAIKEDLPAPTY